MTKYYEVHTKIPSIDHCPQIWYVKNDGTEHLINYIGEFMSVKNIVGTNIQEISCVKSLWCRKEYLICIFESSQYKGDKHEQ